MAPGHLRRLALAAAARRERTPRAAPAIRSPRRRSSDAAIARPSWGVEARGGLRNREGHEVLLGLYAEPSDRLTLKVGVEKGFGGGPDWTARTGIVFRF